MATNELRTFFFLATLQAPDPRGIRVLNVSGSVRFATTVTRQDTFTWFTQTYLPEHNMEGANVMFWQCEPNDYPTAG